SDGDVGKETSITIGADGLGLISYRDQTNKNLKVAHCDNAACTSATISTLDSDGSVGTDTSITIGADGLGLISYYDFTNTALKVAHCSNTMCTLATTSTIDSDRISFSGWGYNTSITIGADGLPLISYIQLKEIGVADGNLKVAHCDNAFCSPYFRRR
ncbi:MAG: hypothetical protein HOK43_08170, partial [Chloroflexi bacterium]|nr:hypothetical protein [Chloroflexota bacterium]